ncbi:MAG: DUF3096 domain-containing protein [Candidatus Aenigmarchaeota archaeon]|nr:DUF3096 domain-containing protein [Candidatus Aenigmarchaeota archaeon]
MIGDILGMFLLNEGARQISASFGIMSIIFGLLILWKPNIISYLIAVYLILTGLIAIAGGII